MGACFSQSTIDWDRDEVELNHFEIANAIGKGGFSRVKVVSYKRTGQEYALKFTEKKTIVRKGTAQNYIRERRILEELNHRYIANLRWAFQDSKYLYFVLDLMLGGDMRFHHDRNKCLGEQTIKIWAAQIICALGYIHSKGIMHRDLKMDNILLNSQGHAHITDFNCATWFKDRRKRTTVTGTRRYMSPEMLSKKGYSWEVDYWGLGNIVYEMLFFRFPFGYKVKSEEELRKAILEDGLKFPSNANEVCSQEGQDFIRGLLQKDPSRRLGCRGIHRGQEDITKHPWFANIDWSKIRNGQYVSGFVPDPQAFNFSINHELDEFMAAEKPLTQNRKRQKPRDPTTLNDTERELEEEFTVYDYSKPKQPYNHMIVTSQPMSMVAHRSLANSTASLPRYSEAS